MNRDDQTQTFPRLSASDRDALKDKLEVVTGEPCEVVRAGDEAVNPMVRSSPQSEQTPIVELFLDAVAVGLNWRANGCHGHLSRLVGMPDTFDDYEGGSAMSSSIGDEIVGVVAVCMDMSKTDVCWLELGHLASVLGAPQAAIDELRADAPAKPTVEELELLTGVAELFLSPSYPHNLEKFYRHACYSMSVKPSFELHRHAEHRWCRLVLGQATKGDQRG